MLSHHKQHQRLDNQTRASSSKTRPTSPTGSGYSKSAPSGNTGSTSLPGSEPGFSSAKTKQPRAHLLLTKGRGTKVFYTVLFRTLDLFSFLLFHFSTLVLSFIFVSAMLSHFTALVHFYISLSLHAHLLLPNANNPKERERYHT